VLLQQSGEKGGMQLIADVLLIWYGAAVTASAALGGTVEFVPLA